jgi:hypothetical protein
MDGGIGREKERELESREKWGGSEGGGEGGGGGIARLPALTWIEFISRLTAFRWRRKEE